jgi:hypothetical protein
VVSVSGSKEPFSSPLVSSSDADPKHTKVVLAPGEEAVILLPLPPYIFRAQNKKGAPEIVASVTLAELRIKKDEFRLESIRKVQSVNSLTIPANKISELAKGDDE